MEGHFGKQKEILGGLFNLQETYGFVE